MDFLDSGAKIANILAVLPGAYCAYGTWVMLHPRPSTIAPVSSGAAMFSPIALLVSTVLFVVCIAAGSPMGLLVSTVVLMVCIAAGAALNAAWFGRREQAAPRTETSQKPAPFEPSKHANEEFPVTRKSAIRDDTAGRTYPLKVYAEIVNNTAECVEIRTSRWLSGTKAHLESAVLQLWLGRAGFPCLTEPIRFTSALETASGYGSLPIKTCTPVRIYSSSAITETSAR